jgi:PAS domain S-box-containing protein
MRPGRFSLSDLSIKHRLPLLIGILLLAIIVVSTWASYRAVKDASLAVGRERLLNLTQQLATLSQQSSVLLLGKTATAANDPAIRTLLQSPVTADTTAAKTALTPFTPAIDPGSVRVELWRDDGTIALTLPEDTQQAPLDLTPEFKQVGAEPAKVVGAIRVVNGTPMYPAVAAAKDESGKVIGYLVRWRRLVATPEGRKQLSDLLGSEADVYFGNSRGDVFTDLVQAVPKPPVDLGSTLQSIHYTHNGESVMALGRPINGTPWFVVVEFPDRAFLKPANQLLRRMSLIGIALLFGGVLGAFLLSRNITKPLHSLTAAASAISGGDYSSTINLRQKDELGVLANAFNMMGTKVRQAQGELERKAQERTVHFEASPSAMLMIDHLGHIALANTQAEKLFGYSSDELLGLSTETLIPERFRKSTQPFRERISKSLLDGHDFHALRKDGSEVPVEIGLNPLQTTDGDFMLASIIDISERRRSEEQFRNLIEYGPNGKVIVDGEGSIVLVNTQIEKQFGYTREELLGQTVEMLVPGRFKNHAQDRIEFQKHPTPRSMGRGRSLFGLRKDGSEFPVEIALTPLESERGLLVVGTIVDITNRRRAEEKLRDSEERLRLSLEGAGLGTWDYRFDKDQVLWDERAARAFGFDEGMTTFRASIDRIHHEDRARVERRFQETLAGRDDGNYRQEFRVVWPDGSIHWILALGRVYFEGEGEERRAVRFTGINSDVSERKHADQALRESEARYRLLFEDSPLPMWVFDRETLRFLAVNEAAIAHYGHSREEFLSFTIKDIRPSEDIPILLKNLATDQSGLSGAGVWRHCKKDGSIIDVDITSHTLEFAGRPAELVLAHDITERKRAEDQLRHTNEQLSVMTQQLWQASKLATMGELAASIAHELNNPLATVALRVEFLGNQLPANDPRHAAVDVIAQEVERMASLVSNLLVFSRRSHPQISTVDLREELSNSLDFVHYHLRNRKINIVKEFDEALPTVQADRQQLRQVFLNLMTNASDAMVEGGTLTVRARRGESRNGNSTVVMEVSDTGTGIKPENMPRLWESFFTTKPEGKGTGLGLPICRRTIEEHRGTIEIESQFGIGTTVRIALPATATGVFKDSD